MAVKLEHITHPQAKNCLRLSNEVAELLITSDVGPRVISYARTGGENLFAIFDDHFAASDDKEWHNFGGHRLWHAPEIMPRTYAPDNEPVAHEWDGATLTLTPPPEGANGLQKTIELRLATSDTVVELDHRITNVGPWDVELAPWCLSVMAPGGTAVVPQEEYRPHPDALYPARPIVLWHFTDMADPRFTWAKDHILLRQDDALPTKQKFGVRNSRGWAAYHRGNDLFVKTHDFDPEATYPDMGCNAEFFTMPGFLEIETLGPLTLIAPGQTISHRERWALHAAAAIDLDEIRNHAAALGRPADKEQS
jgi:hypothetical protein